MQRCQPFLMQQGLDFAQNCLHYIAQLSLATCARNISSHLVFQRSCTSNHIQKAMPNICIKKSWSVLILLETRKFNFPLLLASRLFDSGIYMNEVAAKMVKAIFQSGQVANPNRWFIIQLQHTSKTKPLWLKFCDSRSPTLRQKNKYWLSNSTSRHSPHLISQIHICRQ